MSKQKNSVPFLSDLLTMQHDDYISLTWFPILIDRKISLQKNEARKSRRDDISTLNAAKFVGLNSFGGGRE